MACRRRPVKTACLSHALQVDCKHPPLVTLSSARHGSRWLRSGGTEAPGWQFREEKDQDESLRKKTAEHNDFVTSSGHGTSHRNQLCCVLAYSAVLSSLICLY